MNPFRWLLKAFPWIFVAIVIAIAAWVLMAMEYDAQEIETTYPFECVPSIGDPEMEAINIWLGYANGGWDVGNDVHLEYKHNDQWVDTFRIYHSEDRDEYYVLVYDKSPQDEGNGYLAWHPCGQGAITPKQYAELVGVDGE